uniref:uncharacterized protein LOC132684636 n=1 Tax=Panthera onca TaxID=9690 RepID=UPI002955A5AC|nr:uncharacterized protein LOC132684636 [Panthera onca]
MFPWGLSCLSVLGAAGTALLCAGLLLSLAQHLWTLRWTLSRDRASALPLPKGSMGWPFFGETLHWLVQCAPRVRSRSRPIAQGPREHTQPSPLSSCSLEGTVCHRGSPQRYLNTTRHDTRSGGPFETRFCRDSTRRPGAGICYQGAVGRPGPDPQPRPSSSSLAPPRLQGSRFHSSRRERYGTVFKTHLLGRPVIRVSGAENVRTILLGEHRLVRSQWPQSAHILLGSHTLIGSVGEPHRQRRKVLARAFSRAALQRFVPRLQGVLRREVRSWCAARRPVAVYQASKALTFRMAARILLGLRLDDAQCAELARTFEQFVENLFSLPLDVPFSGLRKVLPLWPQTFLVGLPSVGVSSRRRPVSLRTPRVASPRGTEASPRVGRWNGVAVGVGAGLCPHWLCDPSLSGPRLPGPRARPSSRWLPDFGSPWWAPSPSSQHGSRAVPPGPASSAFVEARMAAEPMGALAPQTLPRPSPGRRGVGAGFPSAAPAPAPLISGSENRCFFRPQSCGPGPESNQEGRISFPCL